MFKLPMTDIWFYFGFMGDPTSSQNEAKSSMRWKLPVTIINYLYWYKWAMISLSKGPTIARLQQNYEEQDSISLPRGALYSHYLDFCQQANIEPMNQASLGKVIRSIFPDVKTRRLGTRGQSKWVVEYLGMEHSLSE